MKCSTNLVALFLLLFSCELPCLISFVVSWKASRDIVQVDGYFSAFAAGTFLYLSLCHLVPEVFQNSDSSCGIIYKQPKEKENESNDGIEIITTGESGSVEPDEKHNDFVTPAILTLSTLQIKSMAFLGLGFGFTTICLLELNGG